MKENNFELTEKIIKIDEGVFDYFPTVIDYDFKKMRPRGLSSKIDFFSCGSLCESLEGMELLPYVFLRKKDTFFEKGMILTDFSNVEPNPSSFVEMIKNLKSDIVYLENSKIFPLYKFIWNIENIKFILMEA